MRSRTDVRKFCDSFQAIQMYIYKNSKMKRARFLEDVARHF